MNVDPKTLPFLVKGLQSAPVGIILTYIPNFGEDGIMNSHKSHLWAEGNL
jgi:hypothetical protein